MARSDIDFGSRPGSNLIDLGQQGLSNGDDIASYIDSFFEDGNQVYIPPGQYSGDPGVFMASVEDASVVGDPEGVAVDRGGAQVRGTLNGGGGNVLVENITFRGVKPRNQSRWRINPQGGTVTLRNINWPDGTEDPSDSQGVYSGEGDSGTVRFENCYMEHHGNSLAYFTYSNTYMVMDGCQMGNSNGAVRPSGEGAEIRNCRFWNDGAVPQFGEEGESPTGPFARPIKFDEESGGFSATVENCHFWMLDSMQGPGRLFDDQVGASGQVVDCRFYNETGNDLVAGGGSMSGSVHVSGGGESDVPWNVVGNEQPDMTKTVWTPVQTFGIDVPGEGGGGDPVDRIAVEGDVQLPLSSAQSNFDTLVRTVHDGFTGDGFIDIEPPDTGWVEWPLNVLEPGTYDVEMRYSNGDTEPRTASFIIGDAEQDLTFTTTGGWDSWTTFTFPVELPDGETRIRIQATGEDAGQIDYVRLIPQQTTPGGGGGGGDLRAMAIVGGGALALGYIARRDDRE